MCYILLCGKSDDCLSCYNERDQWHPEEVKVSGKQGSSRLFFFFFFLFFSSSVFSLLKPYAFVLVPLSPCVSRLA